MWALSQVSVSTTQTDVGKPIREAMPTGGSGQWAHSVDPSGRGWEWTGHYPVSGPLVGEGQGECRQSTGTSSVEGDAELQRMTWGQMAGGAPPLHMGAGLCSLGTSVSVFVPAFQLGQVPRDPSPKAALCPRMGRALRFQRVRRGTQASTRVPGKKVAGSMSPSTLQRWVKSHQAGRPRVWLRP